MVNEDNITKTVGTQARYLAPPQRRFLHSAMFTALNYFFTLVIKLLQADANWMFGVETEQATYDNV